MADENKPAAPVRKFKTKKKLTLATFKFDKGVALYLLALGPIHRGVERGTPRKRPDGTDEEPPMLMHIINMETGEHGQIMVAEIIKTELTEKYPKNTYIGHAFGIMKGERKPGKRYDPYEIEELEIPDELAEASAAAAKEFNAIPAAESAPAAETLPAAAIEKAELAGELVPTPPAAPPSASSRRR